jgi:hypothetical protein
VKRAPLAAVLLAAGVLAAGCGATASSSTAAGSATTPASTGGQASTGSTASASASAPATGGASAGLAACTSASLSASVSGGPGAGMSQNHTGLNLKNTGSTSCTLYGYPGVSWVAGTDGHQVGNAASRQADSTGAKEAVITLAPGETASAPLDLVDAAVISKSECKPVPVRGLRVYPPGEKAALFISLPTSSGEYGECSAATAQSLLSIGYLQPGVQPGNDGRG